MKKITLIVFIIFYSCQGKTDISPNVIKDTTSTPILEYTYPDSLSLKMTNLLLSTKNADKKVKEIKNIKNENLILKKELTATKAELEEIKTTISDTSLVSKKRKKTFIQKVISVIKKDTLTND